MWRRALLPHLGSRLTLAALGLVALALAACGPRQDEGRRPVIVFGIDGGEWRVIHDLWQRGRLPHLKALAERGVSAHLQTDYGESPVIWTTIATGRRPQEHGITGFVVWEGNRQIPVSGRLRRVPALWNMASRMGLRTLVAGWWASWPAEPIRGIVVSDRSIYDVEARVSPPEYLPTFEEDLAAAERDLGGFGGNPSAALRDRSVALTARRTAADFDLQLIYFRGVDIASHNSWMYYEPERFEDVDPDELAEHRDDITGVYEATDAAIGEILAAARPDADVFVISDHGFRALPREKVRIHVDLAKLLRHFGLDPALAVHHSSLATTEKMLRYRGAAEPSRRAALRRRLSDDLARVTYANGAPVFLVRDPRPRETREGADVVVKVLEARATKRLLIDGEPHDDVVVHLSRISGSHSLHTAGVFIAAGPDVDPAADVDGISIHDIAPTLLYALTLPVAEDFAGRAWSELFTEAFRRDHALRTVSTWGTMDDWKVETSPVDEELVEELKSLGYL